ncbi:unnamed protein product [Cylindrotheca closterium]|uniref:Uncharacterized protein n=1 Tax=Cylindrotheca closterium TaxID=2856 RepID=A0AAD2FF18_9STRA|nr:unnamed protein product [Cylindrotheca closterium]
MSARRPSLEKIMANKRSSVTDAMDTTSQTEPLAIKRKSVAAAQPLIQVETFLSRKAYPLGTTLVGTVLVRHPPSKEDSKPPPPLRKTLKSIVVYAAGFCRIDPRWHNATEYARIYGSVHPFIQQVDFDAKLLSHGAGTDTVCFWATNGLELMTLPERKIGKLESKDTDDGERLAFTYRIELPMDLPHSINATTCKYYYMMNILIKTQSKQKVIHSPFVVLTNPLKPPGLPRSKQDRNSRAIISGRVKFGQCRGMAHSIGLPVHLSATEIHRPRGQVMVHQEPRRPDVQTLPIKSPSGKQVCVLTFIGATKITPGSMLQIEWDFPRELTPEDAPCFQVSACLMGEESAVYEDGKTKRTQTHIFDTCHEFIDPGITQRVSKYLLLSVDSPCNLVTDVMELTIKCQVDITIQEGKNGKYNNLKVELPCHVLHQLEKDSDQAELEDTQVTPLSVLMGLKPDPEFPTEDIVRDLKVVSLEMEKRLRRATK